MASQYNVVFTGELKPGFDRETFISAFSQRFHCNEAKAIEVVDAGKSLTMKSAVTMEVAEKFRKVLDELGMTIRIEPVPTPADTAPVTAGPTTTSDNPYQAPQANLSKSHDDDVMSGPESVPFGNGASWIGTAYRNHFKGNALPWIGAFIVFTIINIVLQFVPVVGALALSLISPVFVAGLMLGAKAQDDGEDFNVGFLFSGFGTPATGQLVLVGLLYMIGFIVVIAIFALIMGGSMAMLTPTEGGDQAGAAPLLALIPMLLMMLAFFPLMMAYWFAPALVAVDGLSAVNAMKASFMGCLKNILPFTLYGIVAFVLMFVAAIPLFLGYLILFPVMMASMYTAYRDIYHHASA